MAEYDRYFQCAKELKLFANIKTEKQQTSLRAMSNYDLSVFVLFLSHYLDIVAIKTPNLTLASKQSIKKVYSTTSNLLQSIVDGLASKYITKTIARQEIAKAAYMIKQIEDHLKSKAKQLRREQIADVALQTKSAQFKSIDIADLDKYLKDFDKVTDLMAPIVKNFAPQVKIQPEKLQNLPPPNTDSNLPVDPYASPSNYKAYLDKFTRSHRDAFAEASRQIKIPQNMGTEPGQRLWAVISLPIYVVSNPPLRENELQRAGIKFAALDKNSFILFKQQVLVVYSKQSLNEYQDTVNRAKQAIKEQFHIDYLYSKVFQSKEVNKPLGFIWLIAAVSHLSPFVISKIGIPFAPELKKLEDLTNDVTSIRTQNQREEDERIERVRHMQELVAPLTEQYESIKTQLLLLRKKTKQSSDDLKALQDSSKQLKVNLQTMRPNSDEFKRQQVAIISIDSKIAILEDTIKNERTVLTMGLRQKLDKIMQEIKDFMKSNSSNVRA